MRYTSLSLKIPKNPHEIDITSHLKRKKKITLIKKVRKTLNFGISLIHRVLYV